MNQIMQSTLVLNGLGDEEWPAPPKPNDGEELAVSRLSRRRLRGRAISVMAN
jgi:hypothetical protein